VDDVTEGFEDQPEHQHREDTAETDTWPAFLANQRRTRI